MKKLLIVITDYLPPAVWAVDEVENVCTAMWLFADRGFLPHTPLNWEPIKGLPDIYPNRCPKNYFIEVNEFPKTLEELKEIAMEVFL
jgi:hypothetical protein